MCDVQEWGDGAAAVSGWSKGRREEDTERLNPNEGSFLQTESACVSPADGLLSVESWGVGAKSFPCAQGGPFFIPYFTSLSPPSLGLCCTLFCLLLFCASLCISLLVTFSHTKQRFFSLSISFFFNMEGVIFLCTGCFVLSEEQVGRLVVTGEECWVELFQPVRWLSLPKERT